MCLYPVSLYTRRLYVTRDKSLRRVSSRQQPDTFVDRLEPAVHRGIMNAEIVDATAVGEKEDNAREFVGHSHSVEPGATARSTVETYQ